MTNTRTLTWNTIVQLLGKLVSVVLGLGVVALMTRALGAEGFGQYTTIVAFLQLAGILVDLGLTVTTGKTIAAGLYSEQKLLSNVFSFRTLTALVAFSLAPLAALAFPYPAIIKIGIALVSVSFFTSSIAQTFGAVFQKYLKTGWFVLAELVGRVLLLALTAWAAAVGAPLTTFLWAVVAGGLVNGILVIIFARRLTIFGWEINLDVWKSIWHETWPVALTIALNLVYFKTDTIILSLYKSAADVGIYGASYKVLEILLAIPTIVGGLLLPLVTALVVQKAFQDVKKYYVASLDMMLAVGLGLVAACLVIGREAMIFLAGSEFAIAGEVLKVIAIATSLIFFGNLIGYFILAFGRQKQMIKYYAVAAIVSLIGYFIFIPQYSYWAAAWVTVAIEAFMTLAALWILRDQVLPSVKKWFNITLAAAGLSVFLFFIPTWPFLLRIVGGLIIYPTLLVLFKALPVDVWKVFKSQLV